MTSRFRQFTTLAALTVASALSAWSYPTIFGDSGQVLTPSADVVPFLQFDAAINYTQLDVDGDSASSIPVRLVYGVTPGVEIFGLYADSNEDEGFDVKGFGAKVKLISAECNKFSPSVSAGVRVYRLEQEVGVDVTNAYVVSSTPFYRYGGVERDGYTLRAHIGFEYLRYSGGTTADFFAPFGAVSYEGNGGVSAVLEYLPQLENDNIEFRDATLSGALRVPLDRSFQLEMGSTRPFEVGDSELYLGINYHYGYDDDIPSRQPTIFY